MVNFYFLSLTISIAVCAGFNELALSPPMGWRSWNQFGGNVTAILHLAFLMYQVAALKTVWKILQEP